MEPSRQNRVTVEDKVVLLLALVPYLKENGATKISVLAEKFSVTPAQIRQLATILSMAGIPGQTLTYQHEDLFDINWSALEEDVLELVQTIAVDDTPKFSGAETATLVAGLNLLHKFLPQKYEETLANLQTKLANATTSVNINLSDKSDKNIPSSVFKVLASIENHKQIRFKYFSRAGKTTVRNVDPFTIHQIGEKWYLTGFCYLRNAERVFRVEAIKQLEVTKKAIEKFQKNNYDNLNISITTGVEVLVRVADEARYLIADWNPEPIGASKNDYFSYKVKLNSEEKAIQLVCVAPGKIEVIEPESTRMLVQNWLKDSLNLF